MMYGQQNRSLIIRAPAKLNFHLEVLGKRPDGFHELETVMAKLKLHDTLSLSHADAPEISFECHFPAPLFQQSNSSPALVPANESNLVVRAARLLQTQTGTNQGAHLKLWKRIPVQAGMGGGSSDAAATLIGLNQLWNLQLTETELEGLAAELGSDIPFFIRSHTAALCRGRGEIIEPVSVRTNLPILIVQPETGLSTPEVFKHWTPDVSPRSSNSIRNSFETGNRFGIISSLHNALQKPAEFLNQQVRHTLSFLKNLSLPGVLMTGSGSACFAICHSARQASCISSHLRASWNSRVYYTSLHP